MIGIVHIISSHTYIETQKQVQEQDYVVMIKVWVRLLAEDVKRMQEGEAIWQLKRGGIW